MEKGLKELAEIEKDSRNKFSLIPWLLDTYPFPILKTNAFLKVSEWFKNGSNQFRMSLHDHVFQRCTVHMAFVTEECIKRLSFVLSSNDAIARAICLRVLGLMAGKLADNETIHFRYVHLSFRLKATFLKIHFHSIKEALRSSDNYEMEAAAFALFQLSERSSKFNGFILPFLLEKIDSVTCPEHVRIDLLSCLVNFWMFPSKLEEVNLGKFQLLRIDTFDRSCVASGQRP